MIAESQRLILLAHGSPNPEHGKAIFQISRRVSGHLPTGWLVDVAYLQHQQPDLAMVLDSAKEPQTPALVLPLLIANGEHNQDDVPAVTASQSVRAVRALTPDLLAPSVAGVVGAAADGLDGPDFQAFVLVTGGSRVQNIRTHFDPLQQILRDELGGKKRQVRPTVDLITNPDELTDVVQAGRRTLVVPLLVAPGVLERRFREAAEALALPVSAPIGQTQAFARALARRAVQRSRVS